MRTPIRDRIGRSARLLLIAWVGVLSLFVPTVAHAIVYGEPDGGQHPNVGSFIVEFTPAGGEPYLIQLCTGTLVSSQVVLTASHCMETREYPDEFGETVWFTLAEEIADQDSWAVRGNLNLLEGTPTPDKRYFGSAHYRYDVGAFVLSSPVTGMDFATIAPVGTLDDKSLRRQFRMFTTVGYGIERGTRTKSTQSFLPPQRRMLAYQTLTTVNRDYATFSMNEATGNGGTCYGDSGGPHFDAEGRIVAITTTGDIPCKAIDQAYRVDTEIAYGFLSGLGVPVPVPVPAR